MSGIRIIPGLFLFTALISVGCRQLEAGTLLPSATFPAPSSSPSIPSMETPIPTSLATPILIPTETLRPCDQATGQVTQTSFMSRITGKEFRYRLYLPPCYANSERRYPYLIMLHGLQGEVMNDDQWDRLGLDEAADLGYASASLPPMILVMPNGLDARHWDDTGPYPSVIVDELMPHIEATLCTWNEPSRRAIGGLSRGGFWAYWIGFRYPELFGRVGGHSPFFYDAEYPTDLNPNNLVDTAQGIDNLALYIDLGAQDNIVDKGVHDFVTRLRARGIEPTYIVNETGGHSENYWQAHTMDYLTFYASTWPRDVSQFPSCYDPSPALN